VRGPPISSLRISSDTLTSSTVSIQHVPHDTMRLLRDFQGLEVRLTDERLEHILEHPEMKGSEGAIGVTLAYPERVIESLFGPDIRLYHRFYRGTVVGAKHLCVVVKISAEHAFVLTAYLTDSIKRGRRLWPETE
jgi:hypothetical protein